MDCGIRMPDLPRPLGGDGDAGMTCHPSDCGPAPRQIAGLVAPRTTPSGIEYVTHKMIVAHHGEEWAEKWNKAAGDGNTMVVVEEDGKKVGGTYFHDYERFARVVNYGTPTYFD